MSRSSEKIFERLLEIVNGIDPDDPAGIRGDYTLSPRQWMTQATKPIPGYPGIVADKCAGIFITPSGTAIKIGAMQYCDGDTHTEFHIIAGGRRFTVVNSDSKKFWEAEVCEGSEQELWHHVRQDLKPGEGIPFEEVDLK